MSKPSERVLLDNGQFAPFPGRLEERAIETGAKEPQGEQNEPDPNLPRTDKAKNEAKAATAKADKEARAKAKAEAQARKAENDAKKLAAKALGDIIQ